MPLHQACKREISKRVSCAVCRVDCTRTMASLTRRNATQRESCFGTIKTELEMANSRTTQRRLERSTSSLATTLTNASTPSSATLSLHNSSAAPDHILVVPLLVKSAPLRSGVSSTCTFQPPCIAVSSFSFSRWLKSGSHLCLSFLTQPAISVHFRRNCKAEPIGFDT